MKPFAPVQRRGFLLIFFSVMIPVLLVGTWGGAARVEQAGRETQRHRDRVQARMLAHSGFLALRANRDFDGFTLAGIGVCEKRLLPATASGETRLEVVGIVRNEKKGWTATSTLTVAYGSRGSGPALRVIEQQSDLLSKSH